MIERNEDETPRRSRSLLVLVIGSVWACVVGFLGGLFPAVRAARLPVPTALRST